MKVRPTFTSIQEYRSRRGDVGFWWPYISEILKRHDLIDSRREPVAGFNPTHPTFLTGGVVVKLFGYTRTWQKSHESELAAQAVVAIDPMIAAPRLLAEGRLFDNIDASWPYLVTTRISGVTLQDVELSAEQWHSVTVDVGKLVRRLHDLRPTGVATHEYWLTQSVASAAAQSSLPPHLIAQIDDYLARLAPFDRVFVHGDLCAMHAFVENGRLTGVIDWGDAMVTDRHYELIQLYMDMFHCDKELFWIFLDSCDWPVGKDFPRQTLGLALYRQAVGLAQHLAMDVFEPIAELFPLQDIGTLDELATELFDV